MASLSLAAFDELLERMRQRQDAWERWRLGELSGFDSQAANMEMFNTQAARRIWEERGGVIVCECDNADCFAVIEISEAEYLHASGPRGFWRVTAAGCAYGVVGCKLESRNAKWLSWSK